MAHNGKRTVSTVEIRSETKKKLDSIKGFDGEESYDHLINWLYENRPKGPRVVA